MVDLLVIPILIPFDMSATTCPCVQPAIPVTKEWILQKIQCYQRALQDLTFQLNSFSTIARLPDELLCKIFTFYAADHGIKAASIRQAHYQPMPSNDILVYSFIRVTHVCRYWRDVAMKFTPLWTRISVGIVGERGIRHDAWMAELLRRSGTAPLTVKFSVTSKRSKMVDNILKSEYHRIQDLSIHLIAPIPNASTIFQGVSLLDTLDIEISHFTRKLFPLNVHHLPLPSGSFPQLKTLKTKGMTLKEADYFLQPTLCSFTYLHRPDHYDQGHFHVDFRIAKLRQYLEALRKIPIVEYLCIDTNMLSTSTESQANRRVSLPSLKVLSITENIQTAVCLLNALDTVRLRVLDLTISSRDRPQNPDQIIPTAIQLGNSISTTFGRGNLDTERRGTLKYIRIALGYSGEIDLRASDNLQSLRKTASLDYSNLHVRMDSLGIDYMLELCKTVNFDAIQVIAVTTFGAQMITTAHLRVSNHKYGHG
ncbi:hypothetical protein C8Q75DRAFT_100326 [Abortiporus biennis]|nr:hypothetical protein C8Q75DRAFT_100326 [Abortiporus biennis]